MIITDNFMFCVFLTLSFYFLFVSGLYIIYRAWQAWKQLTHVDTYLLTSSTLCLFVCYRLDIFLLSSKYSISYKQKIINKTLSLNLLHKIFFFSFSLNILDRICYNIFKSLNLYPAKCSPKVETFVLIEFCKISKKFPQFCKLESFWLEEMRA